VISVVSTPGVISVAGHAEDPRVCAAVSALSGTLYAGYGADRPREGQFRWKHGIRNVTEVVDFVMNAFRVLERQYPTQIQVQED